MFEFAKRVYFTFNISLRRVCTFETERDFAFMTSVKVRRRGLAGKLKAFLS